MESNKTIVFHCSQLDLVTNLIEEKLTMKKGEYTLFIIYKKRDVFDLFSGYEAVVRTVCGPELQTLQGAPVGYEYCAITKDIVTELSCASNKYIFL